MRNRQASGTLNLAVFAVGFFRLIEGCPTACSCSDTTVDCSDRNLTEIPTNIPVTTTVLRLNNNELTHLENGSFIAFPEMSHLYLSDNKIRDISTGAFAGVEHLQYLNLDNNLLRLLPQTVFDGLEHVWHIRLSNNLLTTLPDTLFHDQHSLEYLYLERNSLTSLRETIFVGLEKLTNIHIGFNELRELHRDIFKDLENLSYLNCFHNKITHLSSDIFRSNHKLIALIINSNQLTCLPKDIFFGLSNLLHLNLAGNGISFLPESIFHGLGKLNFVNLNSNALTSLPDSIFKGLENLEYIYMGYNSLKRLSDNTFKGLTNLERLYIEYHDLTTLPGNIFDDLDKLREIQLFGNPWSCDCRLQNIRTWLDDNRDRLYFDGPTSLCQAPDRHRGSDMLQVPINDLTCYPTPTFNDTIKTVYAVAGENVSLDCDVVGIPEPHLHWIIPSGKTLYSEVETTCLDEKIIQREDGSLFIPFVDKTEEGVYSCIATNSEGTSSGIRIVKVNSTFETSTSTSPMPSLEIMSPTGVDGSTILTTNREDKTKEVVSSVERTKINFPTKLSTSMSSMQSSEITVSTINDEFTTTTKNVELLTSNGSTMQISSTGVTESVLTTAGKPTDKNATSALVWGVLGYILGIISAVLVIVACFVIRKCRRTSVTKSDENQVQEEYNLYEDLYKSGHGGVDKYDATSNGKRGTSPSKPLKEVPSNRLASSPARVSANKAGHMMYANAGVIEEVDTNYASLSPETRERSIYTTLGKQ